MAKPELKKEKIAINADVEWDVARQGINQLKNLLDAEITYLGTDSTVRNAYSPLTWVRLCRTINHLTEGMAAVRLATNGYTTSEIHTMTGISVLRIAAFRAVNTRWVRAIEHYLTIQWRRHEERHADIAFLRSVGIAVVEVAHD
jgi:hypothetical protein